MKHIAKLFISLIFILLLGALASWVVMGLWNVLMPAVAGFAAINYLQAAGLFVMSQILGGGILIMLFMVAGIFHRHWHHRGDDNDWRVMRRWHSMTDDERLQFINSRRGKTHSAQADEA